MSQKKCHRMNYEISRLQVNSDIEKRFKWFHDDRAILIISTSGIENSKIDVISQVQGEMHEC